MLVATWALLGLFFLVHCIDADRISLSSLLDVSPTLDETNDRRTGHRDVDKISLLQLSGSRSLTGETHHVVEYFSSSDCSGPAYKVTYTRGSVGVISAYQASPCSPSTATGSPGMMKATKYAAAPTLPLGFTITSYKSPNAAAVCAAGGDVTTSVLPSVGVLMATINVADVCAPYFGSRSQILSCTPKGSATKYYNDSSCASFTGQAANPLSAACSCISATSCTAYSCTAAPPPPKGTSLTGGRNTDVTAAVVVVVVVVFGFAALAWAVHALHKIAWKVSTSTKLIEKFARKLYAISPLFFVIYNTIASIYGLGRGSTTKSMGNLLLPASFMGFYGYDEGDSAAGSLPYRNKYFPKPTVFWGHTCTEGVPSALSLTCSFANHPTFQYLVYIWVAFFVLFFLYRVAMLWSYSPDDLRFYIATQRLNGTTGNRLFLFVLFTLSVLTFFATIYSCIVLLAGTSGYIQAAVFVVVNVLASMKLSTIEYKMHKETPYCCGLLKSRKLKSMDLFSKPCPITLPASERVWFNGVFVPHARVFNIIELAIAQAGVGDGSALRAIGDESVLVEYMTELTRAETKDDNKDKEGKEGKEDKAQVDEKGDAKGATTGGRVEGIKRVSSLLPLVLLVLGIFNLIYGGININQVYKPPPSFLKQKMGYFSSDGSLETIYDISGGDSTYLVPGNMQLTELQMCSDIFALQPVTTETLDTHIAASITCNVATSYYMIVLACLCLTFFAVWFGFRLSVTWNYAADDLRFLIATDRANCLYRNLVLCSVGAVLASVALTSIWFYRARVGDPPDTYFLDLVNVSVAIFSLLAYSRGRYSFGAAPTLKGGQESLEMEAFAQPCPLTLPNASLGNLYGGLVSHVKIFNMIELAISQAAQGEGAALAALGDPELIKSYMAKLLSSASAASASAAAAEAKVAEATTTDASSELDSYDAACSPARSKPPYSSAQHGGGKVAPTDETDLDAQPEAVNA